MSKRLYKVIETNFRYKDGSPAPVASTVIDDGLSWYGDGWWHDGGFHKPGDGFVPEFDANRECEFVIDGKEFTGLMDVLSFSYDVTV